MTLTEFLLAGVVVTIGATLQGSIGFGLGMFSVPLLVLIDARLVPGPLLCASVGLTLLLTRREWPGIQFGDLKWALAGRVPGIAVAGVVLTVVPADKIAIAFGILVLLAVALSASGLHVDPSPKTLLGAGALSGFMGTAVAIGGPPMALLYQRQSGARLRGTLSAFFVVGVAMSVAGLHLVGRFGWAELRLAGVLLPGVLLGFFISRRTADMLDSGLLRSAVLLISAVAGIAVIAVQVF